MKPTAAQLARALAASFYLRDNGIPDQGVMPRSFTKDPEAHVRVIAEAVLEDVPEPKPNSRPTRRPRSKK